MQESIRAVISDGRIEPIEKFDLPNGTEVLVTVLSNGTNFWLSASEPSLNAIWDNPEDDVYGESLDDENTKGMVMAELRGRRRR